MTNPEEPREREVWCAASPDHADILETIENAADDWQKQGYPTALAEVRDMANIGRALMEALPEGYSYMNCPSEIVSDLQNERDEALSAAPPSADAAMVEALRKAGWSVAVHNDYRLSGEHHAFWLWTHPDGRYVKGEGRSDVEALTLCATAALDLASRAGVNDKRLLALQAIKVITATTKDAVAGLSRIMSIARHAGVPQSYRELLENPDVTLLVTEPRVAWQHLFHAAPATDEGECR